MSRIGVICVGAVVVFLCALAPVCLAQCTDGDGDGYFAQAGCGTPVDCNDANPSTHPGAAEICDGFDNNCDGSIDEGCDLVCSNPGPVERYNEGDFGPGARPAFAWTGDQFGVVWTDPDACTSSFVMSDRFGQALQPTIPLDLGCVDRVLVWNGSEYGLFASNYSVRFTRLSANGAPLSEPVVIAPGPLLGANWASDHYDVLFFAPDSSGIVMLQIGLSGAVIGTPTFIIASNFTDTGSLAWSGSRYGLVYVDSRTRQCLTQEGGEPSFATFLVAFDSDGANVSHRLLHCGGTPFAIAAGPDRFSVVHPLNLSGQINNSPVFEVFNSDLSSTVARTWLDDTQIRSLDSCSVSWNGQNFGVTWKFAWPTDSQFQVFTHDGARKSNPRSVNSLLT